MSNIYCFLRDAHRHLKKCIWKVLQLLQEGLKNRIVREKVFSAISQKSWVRSYDRVLHKESSSLQLFLNRTPSQVFCRDFCKIVQNSYCPEHLWMVALLSIKSWNSLCGSIYCGANRQLTLLYCLDKSFFRIQLRFRQVFYILYRYKSDITARTR